MRGNRKNHQPDPHDQTETLKTPLLDLGPEVKEISLSNGNRLIYCSAAMRRLIEEVRIFAPLPCDILIIAETGAGKELIAQAIHEQSGCKGPFIDLNCAVIPEDLAESLLFGHVKGAFTGATENTKGIFELAEGGTVFLDEFGELAPTCQAKLLRVLQERKIKRVGRWGIDVPVDVRILAATNRKMRSMVMGGAFREDLIHRFDKSIMIPPLRERREDVLPLANYFINELLRTTVIKILPGLSLSAERTLTAYHFPGNVRELKNIIFHAAVYAWVERSPIIEGVKIDEAIEAAGWGLSETECVVNPQKETRPGIAVKAQSPQGALFLRLADIEAADDQRMRDVVKALRENGGNQAKAAQAMGITRQAMGYHVRKLVKKLLAGVDYWRD